MRRIALIACAALLLSGCVGTMDRASAFICDHREKVAAGARASLIATDQIRDPAAREAAILAAEVLLDKVAKCPPRSTPPG